MKWLALLVITAGGCTPNFDDVTTVKDLRVLAVMAEPPEIVVDDFDALPETFPVVTLRPLVVDPQGGGRDVHYRVLVCPNAEPVGDRGRDRGPGRFRDTISQSSCGANGVVVAEGDARPPTEPPDIVVPIEIAFLPTPAFVRQMAAADPIGRVFGIPVTFDFTISAGQESVRLIKRLILQPNINGQQANSNPPPPELTWRHTREVPDTVWVATDPPTVGFGQELIVEPLNPTPQKYQARTLRLSPDGTWSIVDDDVEEALSYSFFTTAGSFSPARSSTDPPPVFKTPPGLESTYRAPKTSEMGVPSVVDVWVVAREERAGASFTRVKLRLGE